MKYSYNCIYWVGNRQVRMTVIAEDLAGCLLKLITSKEIKDQYRLEISRGGEVR